MSSAEKCCSVNAELEGFVAMAPRCITLPGAPVVCLARLVLLLWSLNLTSWDFIFRLVLIVFI
jgi:hypothetical protein